MTVVISPSKKLYITHMILGGISRRLEIFSDMDIIVLKKDHEAPGVFFKAKKPKEFKANDK